MNENVRKMSDSFLFNNPYFRFQEFANSQDTSDTDFSHGAWQTMKIDLDLEEDNPHSILAKNNIASLLRKVRHSGQIPPSVNPFSINQ